MTKSDRTEEEEKSDQEGKSNCASERQRERDGASNETARRRNVGPVPVFLDRTYAMVDEKSSAEIVAWGALGDTFVIKRLDLFEEEVIPRFFNHRNLFSFVRQLNNHGFSKVRQGHSRSTNNLLASSDQASDGGIANEGNSSHGRFGGASTSSKGKPDPNVWWEFKHPKFQRGRRELMSEIKRRKEKSSSTSGSSGSQAAASDEVLALMRREMEKVKVGLRAVDQKLDTLKELVLSLAFRDGSSNNDNNVARTTVAGGAPTLQLAAAWGGHPGGNGRLAPGLGGGGFEVAGGGWVAGGDAYPVHYLQQQQQGQHVQQQVQQHQAQQQQLWHQHQMHSQQLWQHPFVSGIPTNHGMHPSTDMPPEATVVAPVAAGGYWPPVDPTISWQQPKQLPQPQRSQHPGPSAQDNLSGSKRKGSPAPLPTSAQVHGSSFSRVSGVSGLGALSTGGVHVGGGHPTASTAQMGAQAGSNGMSMAFANDVTYPP